MTITQARIDALNARLTPEDIAAVASDWQAVGDDLRTVLNRIMPDLAPGLRYLNRPMTDADRSVRYEPYLNDDPRDRRRR